MTSSSRKHRRSTPRSLPALLAVGGSLAALPAAALELGDLRVQSSLGQPLRASIAFALAPNEQLSNRCVSLRPGPASSGLPGIGATSLTVANGVIKLTGQAAIREPMMAAAVLINCPYAPKLTREYMVFVDPQTPAYKQTTQLDETVTSTAAIVPATNIRPAAAPVAAVRKSAAAVNRAPVSIDFSSGDRIQVRPGDDLGSLTQRIQNRGMSLWPAAMIVFEANPDAFMDNDPNKLKAGSWLTVPSFDGSAVTAGAQSVVTVTPPAAAVVDQTVVDETVVTTSDLQPGGAAIGDSPVVEAATQAQSVAETVVIPDIDLVGPTTTATSPNVASATLVSENTASSTNSTSTPWLWWLAGSGIALILGLLLFGRRFTNRKDNSLSALSATHLSRRFTDNNMNTEEVAALREDSFDLGDDSPTEENLALDADLLISSDLSDGTNMSVDEDFGFATATRIDIELPFEPEASSDTGNVLTPIRMDENSILDSEVLPDNDDYDMSVIIDATKIPHPGDATVHDLHAVVVDSDEETLITDNYTISKEVDFEILEQDYEDELTATQALNEEITRAAADLAAQMDNNEQDDATAVLPLASVTELDVTSQLPARNDDNCDDQICDGDETGVNETLTEILIRDDNTAEMPISGSDGDTVDMKLGSNKGR